MNGIYQPLLSVVGFIGNVIILISGSYLVLSSGGACSRWARGGADDVLGWFMNPVLNFGNFQNEMMQSMRRRSGYFR